MWERREGGRGGGGNSESEDVGGKVRYTRIGRETVGLGGEQRGGERGSSIVVGLDGGGKRCKVVEWELRGRG